MKQKLKHKCKHHWETGSCKYRGKVSYTEAICTKCNEPLIMVYVNSTIPKSITKKEFDELYNFLKKMGWI